MGLNPIGHNFYVYSPNLYLQNSSLCNGQTIGKRITKIKIVTENGEYLSPLHSIIRSLLLTPILVFNDIIMPLSILSLIFTTIITGLSIIQLALFIFNKPSRQMLHDLIIKSVCINIDSQTSTVVTNKSKLSTIIGIPIVLLIVCIFTSTNYFNKFLGINFENLNKLNSILQQNTQASIIGVNVQKKFTNNQTFTNISYIVTYPNIDLNDYNVYSYEIMKVANEIINNVPNVKNYNQINITILQQVNLGIFKLSKTQYGYGTIQQWEDGFKHYHLK